MHLRDKTLAPEKALEFQRLSKWWKRCWFDSHQEHVLRNSGVGLVSGRGRLRHDREATPHHPALEAFAVARTLASDAGVGLP